jgi:hypothetical protein
MGHSGTRVLTSLLAVGLVVAIFAAPAVAGEQLTKKEFRREANAICETATEEIDAAFETVLGGLPQGEEPSDADAATAVGEAVDSFRSALSEIEGLQGPPAFEKKVDKLVTAFETAADKIEADPGIIFDGPDPFPSGNRRARALGLDDCVQ